MIMAQAQPPSMTRDEILKSIELLDSEQDCRAIQQAANKRGEAIRTEQWKQRVADYWSKAVYFCAGETLYCAAAGTFLGGPMQRGDHGKIYRMDIDGRKKTIWLKIGKRIIGFSGAEPLRYQLQREKPEKPINESEREMANRLSKVLP